MANRAHPIYLRILGCLLLLQSVLLFANSILTGFGWDEWGHLPSGLVTLKSIQAAHGFHMAGSDRNLAKR